MTATRSASRVGDGAWKPQATTLAWRTVVDMSDWRRALRRHLRALTVISHYEAPFSKAWMIVGKASELEERVGSIVECAGYNTQGPHWGRTSSASCSMFRIRIMVVLRAILHFYSVSIDLMDFETKEQLTSFPDAGLEFRRVRLASFRVLLPFEDQASRGADYRPTNLCGGTMRHPFPQGD